LKDGGVHENDLFYCHQFGAKQLDTQVFFCNPYASYERGLNEYINKLIRHFILNKWN
jgi:IS30 family transposase